MFAVCAISKNLPSKGSRLWAKCSWTRLQGKALLLMLRLFWYLPDTCTPFTSQILFTPPYRHFSWATLSSGMCTCGAWQWKAQIHWAKDPPCPHEDEALSGRLIKQNEERGMTHLEPGSAFWWQRSESRCVRRQFDTYKNTANRTTRVLLC